MFILLNSIVGSVFFFVQALMVDSKFYCTIHCLLSIAELQLGAINVVTTINVIVAINVVVKCRSDRQTTTFPGVFSKYASEQIFPPKKNPFFIVLEIRAKKHKRKNYSIHIL
jgi:hypothetical protein